MTGTSTGVGKTVVTAALARVALDHGLRVGVVKPLQTGTASHEPSDMTTVATLSGCTDVIELVRLADPLAPDTAARLRDLAIPTMGELAGTVMDFAAAYDVVLVEGAGGVAVRLDTDGGTVITLAETLGRNGHDVTFVVVTSLALGTLNHTELTLQALSAAGQTVAGLAIGALPVGLGLAEETNLTELRRLTRLDVLATVPAGVGTWSQARFRSHCADWVDEASLSRLW